MNVSFLVASVPPWPCVQSMVSWRKYLEQFLLHHTDLKTTPDVSKTENCAPALRSSVHKGGQLTGGNAKRSFIDLSGKRVYYRFKKPN